MNMQSQSPIRPSPMRMDSGQQRMPAASRPKAGLWKLVAASVIVLLALVATMEIFGDSGGEFASHHQQPTILVE
jgi:hypothetical protein